MQQFKKHLFNSIKLLVLLALLHVAFYVSAQTPLFIVGKASIITNDVTGGGTWKFYTSSAKNKVFAEINTNGDLIIKDFSNANYKGSSDNIVRSASYTNPSGVVEVGDIAFVTKADGTAGVTKKVVSTAGSLVPNSLIIKLTQNGANKLKAWRNGKTLIYKPLIGSNLSGVSAEAKIFEDLETTIGNKNVLETLEDAQGRLSVLLQRLGQTNQVITIHPTSTGEFKMTTFDPAYNPNLNTNIQVPVSANKLVPDYKGTQYMHPYNAAYIINNQGNGILIEMQGTRAKDFSEAFKKLGIKASDADDYTWQHMDDFKMINGKPYCTM